MGTMNWHTSQEAAIRYQERLETPGERPLIIPFRALHKFGGFAHVIDPGKMIGVIGASGGMKTSFVETLTNAWQQQGLNLLWWGIEWDWIHMTDRAVQRYGGPTMEQMSLHTLWLWEEANGITKHEGRQMPSELLRKGQQLAQRIGAWKGLNHQVDEAVDDVEALLEAFGKRIDELRKQGQAISVCVFDYLQLLDLYSARGESEKNSIVLGKIKKFCETYRVVGIIASQVTKSSSAAMKEKGRKKPELLDSEAGQNFRSDKFNLVLTLNPIFEGDLITDHGVVRVTKNSTGGKGPVKVLIDPAHLKWVDIQDTSDLL